jgi:hypothetical protein
MTEQDCRDEMIGIKVYLDTKEEWEQTVEDDPDADTLSQLIRVAVSRHVYDRAGSSGGELSEGVYEQYCCLYADGTYEYDPTDDPCSVCC